MKKLLWLTLILLGTIWGWQGCYPDGPEYVDELDVVYTNYDPDFNFGEAKYYFMPDTLNIIVDENKDEWRDLIREEYTELVLQEIARQMKERGFTRVFEAGENDTMPDLALLPSVIATQTTYIYDPCYWWWDWGGWYPWYPGWGPGWCWDYPWGYPPVVYSYSVGTVIMEMFDPEDVDDDDGDGDEDPDLLWIGGINGLLRSSQPGNEAFIRNGIDQAFVQSPYLVTISPL